MQVDKLIPFYYNLNVIHALSPRGMKKPSRVHGKKI